MIGKDIMTIQKPKKTDLPFSEDIYNFSLFVMLARVWFTNKTKRGKDVPYGGNHAVCCV